jgi:hypothetical protein
VPAELLFVVLGLQSGARIMRWVLLTLSMAAGLLHMKTDRLDMEESVRFRGKPRPRRSTNAPPEREAFWSEI